MLKVALRLSHRNAPQMSKGASVSLMARTSPAGSGSAETSYVMMADPSASSLDTNGSLRVSVKSTVAVGSRSTACSWGWSSSWAIGVMGNFPPTCVSPNTSGVRSTFTTPIGILDGAWDFGSRKLALYRVNFNEALTSSCSVSTPGSRRSILRSLYSKIALSGSSSDSPAGVKWVTCDSLVTSAKWNSACIASAGASGGASAGFSHRGVDDFASTVMTTFPACSSSVGSGSSGTTSCPLAGLPFGGMALGLGFP
mmetsp:Transcript_31070/g.67882  ORF Transcript_31070/g.67882 Transcript_31070/m.67882 type:complete len:254 (-) Transcript_31070:96-857(-)